MGAIEALVPPVVMALAFAGVLIAVKRHNDREVARDRAENGPPADPRTPAPGPRVHIVPVRDDAVEGPPAEPPAAYDEK
jgi:hypothetical protein